jgi:hypothetical protein
MSVDRLLIDHAGNDVVLTRDFLGSRCWDIVMAAMDEAPNLIGGTLVITSAVRQVIEGKPRSWHHKARAVDFRTGLAGTRLADLRWSSRIGAIECRGNAQVAYQRAIEWTYRIAARLGNEFDLVYGIAAKHVNHIHGEHDGNKSERRFGGQ